MSEMPVTDPTGPTTPAEPTDELPASAWGVGWAFLGTQVFGLMRRGLTGADAPWAFLSMVLSAAVVAWFAAGVLRARPLRTGFVWVILVLGLLLELISLLAEPRLGDWFELVVSTIPVLALASFCRSPYFAEQRSLGADASFVRPAIGGVLALAVVTGALGGITDRVDDSGTQIHIGL